MHHFLSLFVPLVLILSLCHPPAFVQAEEAADDMTLPYADGEVIVTLDNTSGSALTIPGRNTSDCEIEVEESWDFGDICISEVHSDEMSTEQLIDTLEEEKSVVSVEPNFVRKKLSTNDSYRPFQWYLNGEGSFRVNSSGIQEKELPAAANGSAPIVAVVDTGIDYRHEDLRNHMWINPYSTLQGIYGYDFADDDDDPMDEDEDGHGTHCAGTISAMRNNALGIAGLSDARLMALKVFDENGEAKDSDIISAFSYLYKAHMLGANIAAVNCSWGGGGRTPAAEKVLIEKIGSNGSLFIFAAGNDGINHDLIGGKNTCPYDIDSDYVITVGASGFNDNRTSYSDYGKTTVDLFAPGEMMVSTVNQDCFTPFLYTKEQRDRLCSYFSSYDTNETILYTAPEAGKPSDNLNYKKKEYSDADFFGADDSGSLCLSLDSTTPAASCSLYMDVTDLHLDTKKSYYVSYEMGLEEEGGISWDHYFSYRNSKSFHTYRGRTYLLIVSLSGDFRSSRKMYFDNPAVSVPITSSVSFGKYNALSGTSMAAPTVTAAAALLYAMYPSDTAAQRKSRLMHCTRATENLTAYCKTGAVLDLSKLSSATYDASLLSKPQEQTPVINKKETSKPKKVAVKKIKLNKKKATLRYGKKLKLKATVSPANATNKKIKWSVSKKKYASVSKKGVVKAKKRGIGHRVKIYAKVKDGSSKKAVCTVKLKRK